MNNLLESVDNVRPSFDDHDGLDNSDKAVLVAREFERNTPFGNYVYCFSFERDSEMCWYVGETTKLHQRLSTHARERDIVSLERIEGVDSREAALEREREVSYEVAIAEESTNIYGGR